MWAVKTATIAPWGSLPYLIGSLARPSRPPSILYKVDGTEIRTTTATLPPDLLYTPSVVSIAVTHHPYNRPRSSIITPSMGALSAIDMYGVNKRAF